MAHSRSAKKRVRQNETRRAVNRWRTRRVRDSVKDFNETILHGTLEQAEQKLRSIYKLLDQVSATGTLHKNTASRYKSRLTHRLNGKRTAKPAA